MKWHLDLCWLCFFKILVFPVFLFSPLPKPRPQEGPQEFQRTAANKILFWMLYTPILSPKSGWRLGFHFVLSVLVLFFSSLSLRAKQELYSVYFFLATRRNLYFKLKRDVKRVLGSRASHLTYVAVSEDVSFSCRCSADVQ